jgi:transcriptional regulator with XRE-family HTH domain
MSANFGASLKRAREQRKLSLSAIAERTKVRASLYAALERNDISHWPAGIFRRAFVRAYAETVGLDPDATVRDFLEHFPDPEPVPGPQTARVTATEQLLAAQETMLVSASDHQLRLPLQARMLAAAWDLGAVFAIAVSAFPIFGAFWTTLSLTAVLYFIISILVLGTSPGICLRAAREAAQPRYRKAGSLDDGTMSDAATHTA